MSGGHFDYKQHIINDIADQLEHFLNGTTDSEWDTEQLDSFHPVTLDKFKVGLYHLKMAAIYVQRIDWLLSADDGEDTFHTRLEEDLKEVLPDEDESNEVVVSELKRAIIDEVKMYPCCFETPDESLVLIRSLLKSLWYFAAPADFEKWFSDILSPELDKKEDLKQEFSDFVG